MAGPLGSSEQNADPPLGGGGKRSRPAEIKVDWDAASPRWLAFSATAAGLLAGYLIKHGCVVNAWSNYFQYRRLCYSDIQALWAIRGIRDGLVPYRDVQMEYPVLTGMFMDLSGRLLRLLAGAQVGIEPSHGSYLVLSALLLAPFGFVVTALLRPLTSARRLMIWAAGTPIILYGFMNWDLPAVAAAAWAVAAFFRKRYGWAGVAAAVGASAKLYPAFLIPALVAAAWAVRQKKDAARLILAFGVAYAGINVPWILISSGPVALPAGISTEAALREPGTNGWLGVWLFHARRGAEYDTVWFWLGEHGAILSRFRQNPYISLGTTALFGIVSAVLLWSGWRRRDSEGGYPTLQVSLGILCAFLVTSKVYSPQYGLWLAPLLALVQVPWRHVAWYLAADLGVFVSRFGFYTVEGDVASGWALAFETSVWIRAAVLVAMIVWASKHNKVGAAASDRVIVSRPGGIFSRSGLFCRCRFL